MGWNCSAGSFWWGFLQLEAKNKEKYSGCGTFACRLGRVEIGNNAAQTLMMTTSGFAAPATGMLGEGFGA